MPDDKFYDLIKKMWRFYGKLKLKTINLEEQKVVYLEANPNSSEIIVMLHGITADKYMWPIFARKFVNNGYRVIIPDLPPFGESSYSENINYSIQQQTEYLKKILTKLGVNKSFHIMGNSMGGGIAGKFTILYPELIKSLVLFDNMGVYSVKRTDFLKNIEAGKKNLMLIKNKEDLEGMLNLVYHKLPFIPSKVKKILLRDGIKNYDRNKKVFDDLLAENWYFENELDKINTATFIMWGRNDKVFDVSTASFLNKGIANSKVYIVDNCGHMPMNENPLFSSKKILNFLQELNKQVNKE